VPHIQDPGAFKNGTLPCIVTNTSPPPGGGAKILSPDTSTHGTDTVHAKKEYLNLFWEPCAVIRAGKNRNRFFNMFLTPFFNLGAERSRFTIAPKHRSCELVNLFSRELPGKLGLNSILAARGCLKHLFLSKSSQTTL